MGAKHHYVPKFLLRQFSQDLKRIDVFQIRPRKIYKNVGLSDQCYEKFYYGKGPELEDAFAKLEGEASQTIRRISEAKIDQISYEDIGLLRQFIVYQGARTKAAAEESSRFMAAIMKEIMRKRMEIEGIPEGLPENVLDMFDLKFTSAQYTSLSAAAHSIPAVYDLDLKFLVSKDESEFILSDSPVIKCNQFSEFHPHFSKLTTGSVGLAQKGIQLFMPVSPRVCIAFYDSIVYEYGSPKRPFVFIGNVDVKLLNSLQALAADTCLYQSPTGPGYDQLCKFANFRDDKIKSKQPVVQTSPEYLRPDGKKAQLIYTSAEKFTTGKKFSFCKVIDNNNYSKIGMLPPRSKELVESIKKYEEHLKRQAQELSDKKS